ncbi:MAG: hypothetical protein KAI63_06405 [Planctomycetes bacterium]|nr:hypothetical protein [Planctomycetota bacterium]
MNKKNLAILVVFGLFLGALPILTGCSVYRKTLGKVFRGAEQMEAVSDNDRQPDDIPVPHLNFKHLPDESSYYETAGVRTATIKYEGSSHLDEVVTFYQTQMPGHHWVHQITEKAGDSYVMAFTKHKEKCVVIAENVGRETNLTIKINYMTKPK